MVRIVRRSLSFVVLAALLPSALAQQLSLADLQSKLVGSWVVTFNSPPLRNLAISAVAQKADNSYIITGNYWLVGQREAPFTDGEAAPSPDGIQVKFTTPSGALMNATLRPDGSFAGMSKFRGGDYPFKVEKGAAVAVATAPAAAPVTTYDGKWSGYAINSGDCVKGEYDIEIKGGKISGTVSFFLRPIACTSTVSGEVGADGTGALRLVKQVPECRSSRFAGKFDGNEFKASDSSAGGRCPYDVTLKKKN